MKAKQIITLSLALLGSSLTSYGQGNNELQTDPGNDLFQRCHQLFKAGNSEKDPVLKETRFKRAIPVLQKYLQQFPEHRNAEPAMYYLGEAYYQIGKVKEAKAAFNHVLTKHKKGPFVAAAAHRLAHDSFSQKRYMEAAQQFAITAANATVVSDRTQAMYYQAQSLFHAKKPEEALALYKKVAAANGVNPFRERATLAYGKLLINTKKYAEAIAAFEALLVPNQAESIKAEAAYHAGIAASLLKDLPRAEKYYKMVLLTTTEKWKPEAYIGYLAIRYKEKDYKGILAEVKKRKYKLTPSLKGKQGLIVGQAYFKMKDYASAVSYFLDVEMHAPGTESAFEAGYFKLLSFYNLKSQKIPEKVDKFIQDYAVGRGTHKYIHQAFLMKAEALYARKNYKDASQSYGVINTKLIDKKYLPDLLYKKGYCLSKVANHAGAANAFTSFIEQYGEDPKLQQVYLLRGESYLKLGNKGRALRDFDEVIKLDAKSQSATVALQKSAQIQLENKQYGDVIGRYTQLIKDFPDIPAKNLANANFWCGWSSFKLKKYAEALTFFNEVQKKDADLFKKDISLLKVLSSYQLRLEKETLGYLQEAENNGLQRKIPLTVYRWLGGLKYNQDDFKLAEELLTKGCEKGRPDLTPLVVWRLLTKAQMQNENYKGAFNSVGNLLSMEEDKPRMVDALLDKAKIQYALDKNGDAKRTAELALEMNPTGRTHSELLKIVGDVYFLIGQPKEAASRYVLLVDAAEKMSIHPEVLDKLSVSLEKMGDAQESKRYADLLKKKYPKYKRGEF